MREILVLLVSFVFYNQMVLAQEFVPNYNEALVPEYNLPNLLQFNNGSPVSSIDDWSKQRNALKFDFEKQMYGVVPQHCFDMQVVGIDEQNNALNGLSLQKQISLQLKQNGQSIILNILMLLPKTTNKVPVFLGYNFYGNQTTTSDTSIFITNNWVMNSYDLGIASNKACSGWRVYLAY